MPLPDQIREEKLIGLAKPCFDPPPTGAEEKVLRDSASSLDQDLPEADAPRPPIRPEFVRWLATDSEVATYIDPKGLRVYAATIPGKLDLRECHVNPALTLFRCDFQSEINLEFAETEASTSLILRWPGAFVPSLLLFAARSFSSALSPRERFCCLAHRSRAFCIAPARS